MIPPMVFHVKGAFAEICKAAAECDIIVKLNE